MDYLPENPILKFYPNTLQYVRADSGIDTIGRIDDSVDILIQWLEKQDHIAKKDFSREYLEKIIIMSKDSIEKAKMKIDKLCTLKTLLPNFYEPFDLRECPILEQTTISVLPNLTENHCRVLVLKLSPKNYDMGYLDFYKYVVMVCEYLIRHDYNNGLFCITDFSDTDVFNLMKNLNLIEFRQFISIIMEGYGARIKGLHYLTPSKAIDLVISLIKPLVSPKVANRIHVHKTFDTLYDHVSKKILPKDYGGDGDSLKNMNENITRELSTEGFKEYFEDMSRACTDEKLRSQDVFNDQYSGMPGSFRKLCVD